MSVCLNAVHRALRVIARGKEDEAVEARTPQLKRQQGQGMVEYALILVWVSIVVIVVLLTMGQQINNVFSNVVVALGGS